MLRLPPERLSDPEWANLRRHDIQERWDFTLAPWVATEHTARMTHALNVIDDYLSPPARVLDVGCAQGTLGHLLAARGFDVTLVDVRSSHIEYAQARSDQRFSLHYCAGLVPDVPDGGNFDLITCTEVVEHMPTARSLLEGLRQKCKLGGLVFLTTPNGDYRMCALPTYATVDEEILAGMEVNSDDADGHRYAYALAELISILRTAGFSVLESGVFLPFWAVGFAKTRVLHRLHVTLMGRPLGHKSSRRRRSVLSRAVGTSLYVVARRTR